MKVRQLARSSRSKPATPARTRRRPHKTLSLQQLRRRLYQAGARSGDASRIAREVKAGPASADDLLAGGQVALGWPRNALIKRYGQRLARAITRFVRQEFFLPDEYHLLANTHESAHAVNAFVDRARRFGRKGGFVGVVVEQSIEQLGLKIPAGASHISVVAPSREGGSMLTWLNAEDETALNEWRAAQPGDTSRAGVVDLMQWPGWAGVAERRAKSRAVVLHRAS